VYGLRGRNFLLAIVRNGIAKGELKVVNDQVGSPTPARLIAQMTARIIVDLAAKSNLFDEMRRRTGVYHLTTAGSTTWFDFARAIFDFMPVDSKPRILPIPTSEFPTRAIRPAYSVLDCSSFDRTFGIVRPHWRDALIDLLRGVNVESLLAQ